jgi:hypothetical protein
MITMLKIYFAKPAQSNLAEFLLSQFYNKKAAVYRSIHTSVAKYKVNRKAKKAIQRFILG